jgi:hypothetical protein
VTAVDAETRSPDAFAERLFGSVLGALELMGVYVGEKLGLYAALRDGIASRDEMANATGVHWRYVGEWLEHQTVNGIIEVDDPALAPADRRYHLPVEHVEVLLDGDSLAYMSAFIRMIVSSAIRLPDLVHAYRTGLGVSWGEFGDDTRTGQAEMNRPFFLASIGNDWFPAVPELHDALVAGARVADIACGEGWSSISIALAYPNTTVDGYDIDAPSISQARRNAEEAGVADRVTFHLADAATVAAAEPYDVVVGFEFVHDLPAPVDVLATMRSLAKPDGFVIVMDEKVGETFTGEMDDVERLMYGFSMFCCLPDAMSSQPSAATGTVMRPSILGAYASEAGFHGVEVLPMEADLWRFYRLKM